MSAIAPLIQTSRLVTPDGQITPEFKRFIDMLQARAGGINGGSYAQLTDQATILWDLDQAPVAVVVLGGNRNIASPSNQVAGPINLYRLTIVQDSTGNRTVTWGADYKFPGGTPPTLSTAANAVDELLFDSDGSNMKLLAFAQDIR
jgi:hypothetical protein